MQRMYRKRVVCVRILSIDPGLMTGVSIIEWVNKDKPEKINTYELDIAGFYEAIEGLVKEADVVVVENFIVTVASAKKDFKPFSLHLIGLCGYLCYHNKKKMILQNPDDRNFTPNQVLKDLNLWHVGGAGHANQASRHAFYYMAMSHRPLAKLVLDTI